MLLKRPLASKSLTNSIINLRRQTASLDLKLDAFEFIKQSKQSRILNSKDYSLLMRNLYDKRDTRVIEIFNEMKKNKLPLKSAHYFFLFGVMEINDLLKIYNYLSKQQLLTPTLLSIIIMQVIMRGSTSNLKWIFNELLKNPAYQFDLLNLTLFLKGFNGQLDMIKTIHKIIVSKRMPIDAPACANLILAFDSIHEFALVLKFYQKLRQFDPKLSMNTAIFGCYLKALSNSNLVHQINLHQLPMLNDQGFEALFNVIQREQSSKKLGKCLSILQEILGNDHQLEQTIGFCPREETMHDDWVQKQLANFCSTFTNEIPKPTIKAAESLLICATKIPSTNNLDEIYNFYKEIRFNQLEIVNKQNELDLKESDWIKSFSDPLKNSNQQLLSRFREWRSPQVPRSVLATVVAFYASKMDTIKLKIFFENEILQKETLELYWVRYFANLDRKRDQLREKTQVTIDRFRGKQPLAEVKSIMSWINRQQKRQTNIRIGEYGPLALIYSTLVTSWRNGPNCSNDPIKLDLFLDELLDLEKMVLMQTSVANRFKTINAN